MILSSYAIQSCMLNDAELLKQRRLRTLRNSILAQLGISEPPTNIATEPLPEEESMKDAYIALRSASADLERENERRCHSEDFYAKPVTSFVGTLSEGKTLMADHGSMRSWGPAVRCPWNILMVDATPKKVKISKFLGWY